LSARGALLDCHEILHIESTYMERVLRSEKLGGGYCLDFTVTDQMNAKNRETMEPPKIDLSNPETVLKELFDEDKWVKDKFAEHLSEDLLELSKHLAAVFAVYPRLNEAANAAATEQAAFVAGFIFGVIDDILVSTKILLSGKMMPAGNVMRQAIEGIALALLCSSNELMIVLGQNKKPVPIRYWEHVKRGDRLVESHKAVAQLELNRTTLGVTEDSVARLKSAKKHYSQFSHPGLLGIASRASLGTEGQVYAGGHFDVEKLDGYKVEIRERIGLCSILPNLIDSLARRIAPR
jgi:hypothetical protein